MNYFQESRRREGHAERFLYNYLNEKAMNYFQERRRREGLA